MLQKNVICPHSVVNKELQLSHYVELHDILMHLRGELYNILSFGCGFSIPNLSIFVDDAIVLPKGFSENCEWDRTWNSLLFALFLACWNGGVPKL